MLVINQVHYHSNGTGNPLPPERSAMPLPEWKQKLHDLIQFYLEHTTPKELGRSLRSYFLLRVAGLTTVSPEWENIVLRIISILELIDEAEDAEGIDKL